MRKLKTLKQWGSSHCWLRSTKTNKQKIQQQKTTNNRNITAQDQVFPLNFERGHLGRKKYCVAPKPASIVEWRTEQEKAAAAPTTTLTTAPFLTPSRLEIRLEVPSFSYRNSTMVSPSFLHSPEHSNLYPIATPGTTYRPTIITIDLPRVFTDYDPEPIYRNWLQLLLKLQLWFVFLFLFLNKSAVLFSSPGSLQYR